MKNSVLGRKIAFSCWLKVGLVLPICALLILASCQKEPGKGGLATITGKVYTRDVNALGQVHDSGYGGGIKVYLSYGDNTWDDASATTSNTGDYAFQGLQKGNYRLTVYSRCETCLLNQEAIIQDVEITTTKQVATMPDFVIYQ